MNLMRAITGDVDGAFWIENEGEQYELHLRVNTVVDFCKKVQLLSTATSGKNEANRGLMGIIRAFFEPVEGVPMMLDFNSDGMGADMSWSMRAYREPIVQAVLQNRTGAAQAWDELEKSVISHVADEVKVGIRFREAETTLLFVSLLSTNGFLLFLDECAWLVQGSRAFGSGTSP